MTSDQVRIDLSRPEVDEWRAVVFDFDGTLIDSRDVKTENYLRAFAEVVGISTAERQTVIDSCVRTSGAHRFVQLDDTLAALKRTMTPEQRETWSERYSERNRKSLETIPEFRSARPVLEALIGAGYTLYAASGIIPEEFAAELERRSLIRYFEYVHGGDKTGFLLRFRELGPDFLLFVGDTGYDRAAAEKAGVDFFLIETDDDLLRLRRNLVR